MLAGPGDRCFVMPWRLIVSDENGSTNNNQQNPAPANNDNRQWWETELTNVRQEAASRRVELREANQNLAEAQNQLQTLTDEKATETERANGAELGLLKFQVAVEAGVPGDQAKAFADLLQGNSYEELKEYAERVKQFGAPQQRPYDPYQGYGPSPTPNVPNTPEAEFLQLWSDLGFSR